MIGGLMKTTSRFAVAAAAGMFAGGMAVTSAQAADLGGDCCADLEERVAELEATTARKGNRKVSLKISGQVNRALLIWDDGEETDTYSLDNSASGTRIRFTGSAAIRPGWSAGYYLEWQMQSASTSSASQFNAGATGGTFQFRHAVWYIKSDKLGKLWLGQHSMATDNLIYMILGVPRLPMVAMTSILSAAGSTWRGSNVTGNPGRLIPSETWSKYLPAFDAGNRDDIIRYDSPDILGCVVSAAWGDDDDWDVAARCKKELNSVKILFGIGYIEHLGVEDQWRPGPCDQRGFHGANDFIVSVLSFTIRRSVHSRYLHRAGV